MKDPLRWSPQFLDFLKRCLELNPADRGTASQMLNHPFLKVACSPKEFANFALDILNRRREH